MTSVSALAVIVGCLPPFKSLFKSHGSFQRYNSPVNGRKFSAGLRLDVMRFVSAGTGDKVKAAPRVISRPIDRKQQVSDGGYSCGHDVPRGAIGVRSDYVSCNVGAWGKI